MNRSKRVICYREALKRRHHQLFATLIFPLLLLDIPPHGSLVFAHGRYPIPERPKMLADKIPASPRICARDVARALPCDKPHHARDRILRRHRQQHRDVIGHQMPRFHCAFLLLGPIPKHQPQVPPQLGVERLAPIFAPVGWIPLGRWIKPELRNGSLRNGGGSSRCDDLARVQRAKGIVQAGTKANVSSA